MIKILGKFEVEMINMDKKKFVNLDSIEDLEDDIEELKDSNKNPLSG